jgi:hypothetical protein
MARQTVRTMCPMNCHPTLCGMLVDLEGHRVASVRGDPDNPWVSPASSPGPTPRA